MKNIVNLVTPFDFENNIDYERLIILLNGFIENNVDGIVVLGDVSEVFSLSFIEKKELVEFVASHIDKRLKVYVQLYGNINEILEFDELINKMHFDGYIVKVFVGNEAGIIKYLTVLADKLSHKILFISDKEHGYEMTRALSYHPNIIGCVIGGSCIKYLTKISSLTKEDFKIYLSDDYLILAGICLGVEGIISVIANCYPNFIYEVSKDTNSSVRTFMRYEKIIEDIYNDSMTVNIKYLLKIKGLISDKVRVPNGNLSKVLKRKIEEDYLNL